MEDQERFTADEAARMLRAEGDDQISKRTINYYAFEKRLIEVSETGKRCFTPADLNRLRGIRLLREHTRLTLDQIKEIIHTRSLDEVKELCWQRVTDMAQFYGRSQSSSEVSPMVAPTALERFQEDAPTGKARTIRVNEDVALVISQRISTGRLKKMVDFIRSLED